jgi:hypothetical protein
MFTLRLGIHDSVARVATCYMAMIWGLNPGVCVRFSVPVQTGPEAHPAPVQWVQGLLFGAEAARVWH